MNSLFSEVEETNRLVGTVINKEAVKSEKSEVSHSAVFIGDQTVN